LQWTDDAYQGKIVPGCTARVAILCEDGNRDAEPSEDEDRLEYMPHDLALLDIRLRDPHLCLYPSSRRRASMYACRQASRDNVNTAPAL
jgi:hypothetical protein